MIIIIIIIIITIIVIIAEKMPGGVRGSKISYFSLLHFSPFFHQGSLLIDDDFISTL